ncbi:tRNA (adenosine(37)-N6)-threonylcarbamoyltransferase complex transferase subunit TsaD [Salinispira pacifica]
MLVLGIESSCDECSVAVVEDGRRIIAHTIATQIEQHKPFHGVVPEIASRMHTEWILPVYRRTMTEASLTIGQVDGIAVTSRPGLSGSLLVGLSFAKGLAAAAGKPFVATDHILAHLYAPRLVEDISYPFIGLLVSGGHTLICRVDGIDAISVMGTTIDDACGEAFDKVAKHFGMGYPGGVVIDRLARKGDPAAFDFPDPSLHKGEHRYDVSYSGLKTAVANQLDQFWNRGYEKSLENIAASFERAAVDMLLRRLFRAVEDSGVARVVAGGGVAANSYLRKRLAERNDIETHFPPPELCTDNGAMVAGFGYHLLSRGERSPWSENVHARVSRFRHTYP